MRLCAQPEGVFARHDRHRRYALHLHANKVICGVSIDWTAAQYTIEQFEKKFSALLVGLAQKLSTVITS